MSVFKNPILAPRLLASLASSCITLDVISFAMATISLLSIASAAKSTKGGGGSGKYLIPILRVVMSTSAIVLAAIYLANFFMPPFSCGPLHTSWAFYFVNQISTDSLLIIRIFAFKPKAWVRWTFMGALVLIDIVLRAIYFGMSTVVLTPAGICATIPNTDTGFALFGFQLAFYLSIASYFSYNISILQKNSVLSTSPLFIRVDRLSKVLFLGIFVAQLCLYTPFYFSSLGSSTIVLVHILITVQTLLINLSFELAKSVAERPTSVKESSAKGEKKSTAAPRKSDIKREIHDE